MYARLRHLRADPGASGEVIRQINEELRPAVMGKAQGAIAYYILDGGEGEIFTMVVCEDRAGLEEAGQIVGEWVSQNLNAMVEATIGIVESFEGPIYGGVPFLPKEGDGQADDQQLLSVEDVCRELGMGKSWVYRRIRQGEIPSVKLGGSIRVRRGDLQQYIKQRSHPPDGKG